MFAFSNAREALEFGKWVEQNFEAIKMVTNPLEIGKILYKQVTSKALREPKTSIPIIPFDKAAFLAPANDTKVIWYGHSVILMNMNGKIILIDPMLGSDASPVAPVTTKRFSENSLELINDFPEIDVVLISHDHYDHLDFDSILKLIPKTKQFFVAMGLKRHLIKWGVAQDKIQEFDWWNNKQIGDINIFFTPTRHFSGRGLTDRFKSLWGGWAIIANQEKIWFSGDGGFGKHFKEIGNKLGPFDFAFMECGQYNEKWRDLHLLPADSVQAAKDGGVKKAMPVHWAGFALALHSWAEPVEEFAKFAKLENLEMSFPRVGQMFTTQEDLSENRW